MSLAFLQGQRLLAQVGKGGSRMTPVGVTKDTSC